MWMPSSTLWSFLCVITTVSAAVSRNLQSPTPRYTTDVSKISLNSFKDNLDNKSRGFDEGEVSRKLINKRIDFVVHKGNENHFQLRVGDRNKGLANTTLKPTTKEKLNSVKPTPNRNKFISPKPLTVVVEKPKNHTAKKKTLLRPKPITISSEKLKFQNGHYRNYTKFRIKPSIKQSDVIPVVSTYAPEYLSSTIPPLPSYNELQINPEISTYSPQFSIGSPPPIAEENPLVLNALSPNSNPFGVPISQVVIQSLPVISDSNSDTKADLANDCPSFQITSNLYTPQRQACSDINVVINSQLGQSNSPQRQPEVPDEAVAEPVAAEPVAAAPAVSDPVAAEPAAAAPAAAPAASPAGSSGGSQGSNPLAGGLPMLPELPELSLPDLKGLMDLLGALWNGLRGVLGFLSNPYLYIVPIALSFGLGFILVLIKIKWFVVVPAIALYGYLNRDAGKPEIIHHKYPVKVVHHDNGWFYNQGIKTYDNIMHYMHPKKIPINLPRLLGHFEEKGKR